MPMDNEKGSDINAAGSRSLTDSPYVGGNKMSSSLKDRLKRFRKYSSPISRPSTSAAGSIQFETPAQEYSKEDIENAMNEPESEVIESGVPSACSDSEENSSIDDLELNENSLSNSTEDFVISIYKPLSDGNINASSASKKDFNNSVGPDSDEDVEISVEVYGPEENTSFLNDDDKNNVDKSGAKLNENVSLITKGSFGNGEDRSDSKIDDRASCCSKKEINKPVIKINKNICSYSEKDIEKCADKESVLEIYHDLHKEYVENQEKLRKLKLVQKHHTKNSPEALQSLNQKWMTCTQLALRKLYAFMPEPRSITFETFLDFLQVDFDAVKYNPETDSFA